MPVAWLTLLWLRVVRPRLPRAAAAPATTALGPLPTARPAPQPAAPQPTAPQPTAEPNNKG
ncbi:hypothetical protein [Streptomyces sp. NPDC001480]|uniref:hypothetical protein n=1 Tax=Streptomyces sp. NPDC001480 TaxID=3364577 RepID=UPI0036C7668F